MRYEQNGVSLWFGTPDAPAPGELVTAGPSGRAIGLTVTVGVQPINAKNTVQVRYRVNGGAETEIQATLARTDVRAKCQYFVARLPEFTTGAKVDYGAVCNCAGIQVPVAGTSQYGASFQVTAPIRMPAVHLAEQVIPAVTPASRGSAVDTARQPVSPAATKAGLIKGVAAAVTIPEAPSPPTASSIQRPTAGNQAPASAAPSQPLLAKGVAAAVSAPLLSGAVVARAAPATPGPTGATSTAADGFPVRSGPELSANPLLLSGAGKTGVTTLPSSPPAISSPNLQSSLTALVAQKISTAPTIDINLINAVLRRNPALDPAQPLPPKADLTGLSTDDQVKAKSAFQALQQEIKMFPGFDYRAALASGSGPPASGSATPIALPNPVRDGVGKFLANSPDFDLRNSHIASYIAAHGATAFAGISEENKAGITDQLNRTQRIMRVTSDPQAVNALMGEGLHSAFSIASVPRSVFLQKFSVKLGSQALASNVYNQARFLNAYNINLYGGIHQALNDVTPFVIGNVADHTKAALTRASGVMKETAEARVVKGGSSGSTESAQQIGPTNQPPKPVVDQIPDWETLFGSLSFCNCSDCRSVYSPAAYFVDLLQFLRNSAPNSHGYTPLDILVGSADKTLWGRRPDLPYIKLNCENTNTELPYVDLVNEILEACGAFGQLDWTTAKDTGDATADELAANPQYINNSAYDQLRKVIYPLTLPFNQPLEVMRAYLDHLGSSRYSVMESCQAQATTATTDALAAEYLRISPEEYQVLTGKQFDGSDAPVHLPLEFYGYSQDQNPKPDPNNPTQSGSWEQFLTWVPEFLQRTGVAYTDLIELVKTRFINPKQAITLEVPADADPCDLTQTTIKNLIDDATWNNLNRFIRLWRKLGWKVNDLDNALAAFSATDIDAAFLLKLASVREVQAEFKLPLDQLLSFWANIDAHGRGSLYVRLFQNRAVLSPLDSGFALTYTATLPQLPPISFTFPESGNQISYNPQLNQLAISGQMTKKEQATLLALSSDPDYGTAINTLATNSRKVWSYHGVIFASVPLKRLPVLVLPGSANQISYNGAGEVTFVGVMSEQHRSVLRSLSGDPAYVLAVENLFQMRDNTGLAITGADALMSTHAPTVLAALRLRSIDLAVLTLSEVTDDGLTLANLSKLYRWSVLAKALGASVADTLSLKTLLGADPFADPIGTITFIQRARKVLHSKFSLAQLNYLYRDLYDANGGIAPLEANIELLMTGLQSGLAKLAADNTPVPDPKGDLLRQKLGALLLDSSLVDPTIALISGGAVYSAPLNALPNVTFPKPLDQQITYDANGKQLRFTGVMTDAQTTQLLGLSGTGDYQAAINALAQQPRDFISGVIIENLPGLLDRGLYETSLATLAGVNFPPLLQSKIAYDSNAHQLRFTGAMTDAEKTQLESLPGAGSDYLAAVESLYAQPRSYQSTTAPPSPSDLISNILGNSSLDASDRFYYFLARAMAYLRDSGSRSLIKQILSDNLKIDAQIIQALLEGSQNPSIPALVKSRADATQPAMADFLALRVPPPPDSVLGSARSCYRLLHKISLLVNGFKMGFDEVTYLSAHSGDFANFDLNSLPLDQKDANANVLFSQWERLNSLFTLRDGLSRGNVTLLDVFGAGSLAEAQTNLASLTAWDPQQIAGLTRNFGLAASDFKNEIALVKLQVAWNLLKRVGVSADQLFTWAQAEPDATQAQDLKNTVKAKYDDQTWLKVAKALNDRLREKQREALLAYVLIMPDITQRGIRSSDELYEYFLIDVNMSPCMMTSRIVQATAAIQLFVQRCLMNLESVLDSNGNEVGITPSAIDTTQWEWMKLYRLWEANREVFLYPENWIYPELRDDRSPFFKDLQSELLQSELTAESAEEAFGHYLAKLDEVAHLEICGMYWQDDVDPQTTSILHVFGRTHATPRTYYYRKLVSNDVWTPWEKVQVDIQSVEIGGNENEQYAGVHLIPVVWNTRLYIFWPIFSEKAVLSKTNPPNPPQKYWEISLAWSEYREGGWSAKKTSTQVLTTQTLLHRSSLVFKARAQNGGDLIIRAYYPCPDSLLGDFRFGTCGGSPTSEEPKPNEAGGLLVPDHSQALYMSFTEQDKYSTFWLNTGQIPGDEWNESKDGLNAIAATQAVATVKMFATTPSPYDLLYPHQYGQFLAQGPFFYQDDKRAYLVSRDAPDYLSALISIQGSQSTSSTSLAFQVHYHPHICDFITALNQKGIPGLLALANQSFVDIQWIPTPFPQGHLGPAFEQQYSPTDSVCKPYPQEVVDFTSSGAYSLYNWELFFHIPLLIATRLAHNQRFEDAQKWFHYIFNPTADSSDLPPARYWNFLPFQAKPEWGRVEDLLRTLADPTANWVTLHELGKQINEWKEDPFNPDLIARLRPVAYQKSVVMKYLDNLIAWGDYLFSQNTRETINQAQQLYVLAFEILGPRPVRIPPRGTIQEYTYNDLARLILGEFSNPLITLENTYPYSTAPAKPNGGNSGLSGGVGFSSTLYFCVPQNDQLLAYWDTVADRLFKIRHCMTIGGVVQQLPLFAPPIDPGLLVQAAAMGLDLSSVLADIGAPVPYYRFAYVMQKALDLCGEVRALGSALLSALEKRDAESLALLRATQETYMLGLVTDIKQKQVTEAQAIADGLAKTLIVSQFRQSYYGGLLTRGLISEEQEQLDQLDTANNWQMNAAFTEAGVASLKAMGEVLIALEGGPITGQSFLADAADAAVKWFKLFAEQATYQSTRASIVGSHCRRSDEWTFQRDLASKESDQINSQIDAANIRVSIAQTEFDNHNRQIQDAQAIADFLTNKYTNQDLYDWMALQVSAVYFDCYQMAYGLAKKAECAFRFERGVTDSNYIQFGYWDSLKKGLLAGERLYLDLKRLDSAYLDQNKRDYEITKHISLVLTDPLALITLKQSGLCLLDLPEALFDADYPGHYMRRIKSVSLTIPAVTGPYTSVNATLTLLKTSIRMTSDAGGSEGAYLRDQKSNDPRFVDNFGAIESIATSHGQSDSGMFELNFRDERYLPFEGKGAISTWQIDLPTDTNAFDFETISDIVINLNYTAREGGDTLRQAARNEVLGQAQDNMLRMFSFKHEFPSEWYRFLQPPDTADRQSVTVNLTMDRFPFQFRGTAIAIDEMELFLKLKDIYDTGTYKQDGTPLGDYTTNAKPLIVSLIAPDNTTSPGTLASAPEVLGGVPHTLIDFNQPQRLGIWSLQANDTNIFAIPESLRKTVTTNGTQHYRLKPDVIEDIVLVCHYSATPPRKS